MSQFRIASDLHLEFLSRPVVVSEEPLNVTYPDIGMYLNEVLPPMPLDSQATLILSGDTSCSFFQYRLIVPVLCARFQKVIIIPGNHEFYGHSTAQWDELVAEFVDEYKNLYMALHDEVMMVPITDHEVVLATTLWSDAYSVVEQGLVSAVDMMSDFRQILNWTPERCSQIHKGLVKDLTAQLMSLKEQDKKVIVATHHLPSFSLINTGYVHSRANAFYASNLNELLAIPAAPKIWIHGHSHRCYQKRLGRTWVVANTNGYPGDRLGYDPEFVLDFDEF